MKYFLVCALCLFLQACGGGGAPDAAAPASDPAQPPASCSIADQQQSLRTFMGDQYLWYSRMATPDPGAPSMDAYFQSMLLKPDDHFSFSQATDLSLQAAGGRRTGYGYTLAWNDAAHTQLRVREIEIASPMARAGVRRGDTVLEIDGMSPEDIAAGRLPTVTTAGVPRTFKLRDLQGATRVVTVVSENFALNPIVASGIFDATRGGAPVKVGYVAYNQFLAPLLWELALKFQEFADAGVGEVVLDLRYNPGGSIGTARDLAGMISGSQTDGQVFTRLRYSDKQAAQNVDLPFADAQTRFARPIEGLKRVFILTSGGTASASELVINGLKPFMQVVLVGETTFGKPYGFAPHSYCGTTYNAVQFQTLNALGVGGYTGGFAADCAAADDLDRQLGDPAEGRTRAALDYIATGRCSAQAPLSAATAVKPRTAPAFGEVSPPRMFAP